jgi:hypothetical protein
LEHDEKICLRGAAKRIIYKPILGLQSAKFTFIRLRIGISVLPLRTFSRTFQMRQGFLFQLSDCDWFREELVI